jgi:hypothetical protein
MMHHENEQQRNPLMLIRRRVANVVSSSGVIAMFINI